VIGTSCAVLWTRRSQSSFISLIVWLAVVAYSVTYLTTRNSLKLWNWHIRSNLQNHTVKECNSKFRRRNLHQTPNEFENPVDVPSCPHVSGKKQNLEQSIIETASPHLHSLIDNFEAYFPKQQATELQTKLRILSLFGEQHSPGHWGTNLKNDLCQQASISRGKHAESWVRALAKTSKSKHSKFLCKIQPTTWPKKGLVLW